MLNQFFINVVLAVVWMFLQPTLAWENFVVGYVLGLLIMYFVVGRLKTRFYMSAVVAFILLLLAFLYEVMRSSVRVSYLILHPRMPVTPGLVSVPLDVKSPGAITCLAAMVTMAPGTFSVELSDDRSHLYIHALEADDPEAVAADIKHRLERRILQVWR